MSRKKAHREGAQEILFHIGRVYFSTKWGNKPQQQQQLVHNSIFMVSRALRKLKLKLKSKLKFTGDVKIPSGLHENCRPQSTNEHTFIFIPLNT